MGLNIRKMATPSESIKIYETSWVSNWVYRFKPTHPTQDPPQLTHKVALPPVGRINNSDVEPLLQTKHMIVTWFHVQLQVSNQSPQLLFRCSSNIATSSHFRSYGSSNL